VGAQKIEKSLLISGIKPRPSSQQPVTLLTELHQLRKYTSNSLEIVIDVGVEPGDMLIKGLLYNAASSLSTFLQQK
jgi:hypothetical protein